MSGNINLINDLFTIKKLFTEGYFNYRFSSMFISTIDNMVKMTVPNVEKIEYNDINKYIEIIANPGTGKPLVIYMEEILTAFVSFCYNDRTMREILMSIDIMDFKTFDTTMRSIYESKAYGIKGLSDSYVATNLFNVVCLGENIVRVNLT